MVRGWWKRIYFKHRLKQKDHEFPTVKQLYNGALLRAIAHAVWTASVPFFAYEIYWNRQHYHCKNLQGTQGTVTFTDAGVVGTFNDFHSDRNPFIAKNNHKTYDINPYFVGIPEALRNIAEEETIQYLIEDYRNQHRPIVTTAFWSIGEYLTAAEEWKSVYKHGAHLLRIELMSLEDAIPAIEENYEFPVQHLELIQAIFNKRKMYPHNKITLTEDEYALLISEGNEGISKSKELFEAIQIYLPMQL